MSANRKSKIWDNNTQKNTSICTTVNNYKHINYSTQSLNKIVSQHKCQQSIEFNRILNTFINNFSDER